MRRVLNFTSGVIEPRPAGRYPWRMVTGQRPVGELLREWRKRRRWSQLDLACEADISARHLSFVETGRSRPSRGMVLHLADRLEVPMRERNGLLLAAGYAPNFAERRLDDPALAAARGFVELVLDRQRPYPAYALDRHWTIVASNGALPELNDGVAEFLLRPPVNVLRLCLHPQGLAPRIVNLAEIREHLLFRLRRQIELSGDPELRRLLGELTQYPVPDGTHDDAAGSDAIAVPFTIDTALGRLSFLTTTTVFGTPLDVTLAELALELFFPADIATAAAVAQRAGREIVAAAE